MTIQTINITVPGGDTPRSANIKINANFSDATHAASKLVGTAVGQIPLATQVYKAAFSGVDSTIPAGVVSCNDLDVGTNYYVWVGSLADTPVGFGGDRWIMSTQNMTNQSNTTATRLQVAWGFDVAAAAYRVRVNGTWTTWTAYSTSKKTYSTTTASGANAVVTTTGELQRSTSSERYKDILAPLELDDARYADAMALKPIVYRSTADADNPAYHYYSFSAEELGAYDPAFTLWRETEIVTDEDGNVTEQALAERQAEGININALLAISHAIAIKQDKLIKKLQTQVGDLQSAVATLQTANNP